MLKSTIFGIDLAKNIIKVCQISKHGELVSNKAVSRQKLKGLLAIVKPSVVAIEGCGSSHYWGRYAEQFGHDVRIISPKKVKGFLEGHKTDANDALAIANASLQIGLKSSKPKNEQQQTIQTLETSRVYLSRSITSLSNHLRAMLYEYGIVSARGAKALTIVVQDTLNDADSIPECLRSTVNQLWLTYSHLKQELAQLIKTKNALSRQLQPCKKLIELEGVAEVCSGMLYSSIGDGKQFKNGWAASAFIGLTPKQHNSGGTVFMTGIDRAGGIKELRSALYQGALSYICRLPEEPITAKQAWLIKLVQRAGIIKHGGVKELRCALYQGAISIVTHLPDKTKTVKQAWLIQLVKRVGIKRTYIALAN